METKPMRRTTQTVFRILKVQLAGTLICAFCAGCGTTGYLANRSRDAADIFTATVGTGVGAKVRIGPVQAGLLAAFDMYGLRGGCFGELRGHQKLSFPYDVLVVAMGRDYTGEISPLDYVRDKRYDARTRLPFISTATPRKIYQGEYSSEFPYDHVTRVSGYCESYYTQIEIVCALGPSIRLGFNPGELLDYLLGWTLIDIYGDDLEKRATR